MTSFLRVGPSPGSHHLHTVSRNSDGISGLVSQQTWLGSHKTTIIPGLHQLRRLLGYFLLKLQNHIASRLCNTHSVLITWQWSCRALSCYTLSSCTLLPIFFRNYTYLYAAARWVLRVLRCLMHVFFPVSLTCVTEKQMHGRVHARPALY